MQHATNSYQQKTAIWQANIDTLSTDLRKQIIDYEKAAPKLTSNEQKLTQELIRTKQKQLRDYEEAIQNKLSKKTQNLLAKLLLR